MYRSLSPGAIGIRGLGLPQAIELAQTAGFAGLDFSIREAAQLAETRGMAYLEDLFAVAGVRPAQWGLPVAWQREDQWQADLQQLPRLAAIARALGSLRTTTWMPAYSDSRPYPENFAWHVERFRPIAEVLKEHGCRFGIEFIGPRTYRAGHRYEFISTLGGLLELAAAIGTGNVGVLLDSYHLYTSGGSIDDLDRLTATDVVAVHVNDAIAGVPRDEQLDQVRALPLETGVIDLVGFMRKLQALGYDGPVTVEPFSRRLNELAAVDPLAAARETAESLARLWHAAGLDSNPPRQSER